MWFSRKKQQHLSDEEENWITSNFLWLVETFGLKTLKETPLLFINETHLPNLYKEDQLSIDGALLDLKNQFRLTETSIVLELKTKDKPSALHEIVQLDEKRFKVILYEQPGDVEDVIFRLAISLCSIKLLQEDIILADEDATDLFQFITLTYFGFGDLLSRIIFQDNKGVFLKEPIDKHVASRIIQLYLQLKHLKMEESWFNPLKDALKTLGKGDEVLTEIFLTKVEKTDHVSSKLKNAWKIYESGMTVLAISVCKEILPQDPQNIFLLNSLGYFLLRIQQFEEAIHYLKKALEKDSEFATAHNNLGYAYLMTNDLEKGNHHLKIAFSLDNKNALIERNLGIYKASTGEPDEAIRHFDRAQKLESNIELINYFIGLAYLEKKDKIKAKHHFEISLKNGEKEAEEMLNSLKNE